MTDREFVEAHWDGFERVFEDYRDGMCCGYPHCDGDLPGEPHENCCPAYIADENYWSAAAAFTRERLEEVRQLREEIALHPAYTADALRFLYRKGALLWDWDADFIADIVIRNVRLCRTLFRLESELTRLTAGMKEVA